MSMAEAAGALGVSVPTVRQMVARGQLSAFRTPGGHLRFTADSVRAATGEASKSHQLEAPSSPLHNRRERIEELHLEAQELRAQSQLEALRREQEREAGDRRAEAEVLREERQKQSQALLLDHKRVKRQEAEERTRRREEAELQSQRQRFVSSWLGVGLKEIPPGVPPELRREVMNELTRLLSDCQISEREIIAQMVSSAVAETLAPWRREQQVEKIIQDACSILPCVARGLSWCPTEWDLKALEAAFAETSGLTESASMEQIRTAARLAVKRVANEYVAYEQRERLLRQKSQSLGHWFLYLELSTYVRQLLDREAIELERGETLQDVVSSLEAHARKYLDDRLTGAESKEEVLKLLREFVRSGFEL
jgi:excisionase family DNA binding protein